MRAVDVAAVRGWATDLETLRVRVAARFGRACSRVRAHVAGLPRPVERKNGWRVAEQAGEATPYGMPRLPATAKRDPDAVRDDLRDYAAALERAGGVGDERWGLRARPAVAGLAGAAGAALPAGGRQERAAVG